jgi:hypothetical protein
VTVLPTVRRQILQAAQEKTDRRVSRIRRSLGRLKPRYIVAAAGMAVPVVVAGAALILLSHRQTPPDTGIAGPRPSVRRSIPPASRGVHVQVTQANRYCTSRRGVTLERCQTRRRGLIRLGGADQQWLVIFSFIAPQATTLGGRTYYYFTADVPGQCPNVNQFGEYDASVRTGQRVVFWAAFDKDCPGPGHGTISLITRQRATSAPGQGTQQRLADFNFAIPRRAAAPGVDPAVAAQLSVFRRPSTSADIPPAGLTGPLQAGYSSARPDMADARRVTASDGQTAYLIPDAGGVCVANANQGFCSSATLLAGAQRVDLCSPTLTAGDLEIEWLLPDGATQVALGMTDRTVRRFPAADNVYIARLPLNGPLPSTIEWDDRSGLHHSISADVPSDAHNQSCAHPRPNPPTAPLPPTPKTATAITTTGPGVATVVTPTGSTSPQKHTR